MHVFKYLRERHSIQKDIQGNRGKNKYVQAMQRADQLIKIFQRDTDL